MKNILFVLLLLSYNLCICLGNKAVVQYNLHCFTSVSACNSNSVLPVPVVSAPPSVYGDPQLASFPPIFCSPLLSSFFPELPVWSFHTRSQTAVSPPVFSHPPEYYRTNLYCTGDVKLSNPLSSTIIHTQATELHSCLSRHLTCLTCFFSCCWTCHWLTMWSLCSSDSTCTHTIIRDTQMSDWIMLQKWLRVFGTKSWAQSYSSVMEESHHMLY